MLPLPHLLPYFPYHQIGIRFVRPCPQYWRRDLERIHHYLLPGHPRRLRLYRQYHRRHRPYHRHRRHRRHLPPRLPVIS